MRSEDREPGGARSAPGSGRRRLGERLKGLSGWLRDRQQAPYRVAALAILVAIVALVSSSLLTPKADQTEWLDQGRAFPPDQAEALLNELALKGIDAQADDRGRVSVPPARLAEALKVLDQLGLSRRALIQEVEDPTRPPLMADATERTEIHLRAEARKIERALEEIPGIQSAVVVLMPKPGRPFARPEAARAGVHLRADRSRSLSPTTVDRVLNVIATFTQLKADDVTIIDAQGDALLKAGDPGFARSMRAEALARSWEAAIAEQLSPVIDGALVEVRLDTPIDSDPPAPVVPTIDEDAPTFQPTPLASPAPPSSSMIVKVVPNGPLSLDPPPESMASEPPAASSPVPAEPPPARANVLVKVPASYYLARHDAFLNAREPKQNAIDRFVAFTEDYVRTIIAHVIPETSLGRVQILMQPLPNEPDTPRPIVREARQEAALWWVPAAVLGGVAGLALIAAASGWLSGRRPALRASSAMAGTSRPHLPPMPDDDTPGPADRVRELVRSDPSAAAAVLRRWVEQGADT
ncbi:hypothetical protein [Tautonia rosea]|uniref:hypothetical protein n=1 Tax=Tautonia rosea TaxID=2728037 RepID=UPI0014731CEF|nr:hypothetical protein [Tautonia rosea]